MAISCMSVRGGYGLTVLQQCSQRLGKCRDISSAPFRITVSCSGISRTLEIDIHSARRQPSRRDFSSVCAFRPHDERRTKIIVHGGRAVMYEDADQFVLLEPGEEEEFVNQEELQERLRTWLSKLAENERPMDLIKFDSLDEGICHLIDSACELDLGGGLGSVQWFRVRLEQFNQAAVDVEAVSDDS